MRKLFLFLLLFLVLINSVSAVCTVTLNKETYAPEETATATMSCSENNERAKAYSLTWDNGTVLEVDGGTTPSSTDTLFFETYIIPEGAEYPNVTVVLTGTALEGDDWFVVSSNVSSTELIIFELETSEDLHIGRNIGVHFDVADFNGVKTSNVHCSVHWLDENGDHLRESILVKTFDGESVHGRVLDFETFLEDRDFAAMVHCFCGKVGTPQGCTNKNGDDVSPASSTAQIAFRIDAWLDGLSTLTNKAEYTLQDENVIVCVNMTNNQDDRLNTEIYYDFRCGGGNDALDRTLIGSTTEIRGINANLTQNQCARVPIKNVPEIQNKVNECYASTSVRVFEEDSETFLITYESTSAEFNITSTSTVDNSEVKDMTAGIAIAIFIIVINLFLILLPFFKKFSDLEMTDLIIRRGMWTIAAFMMALNSAIMATIAESANLALTQEMFRYMWIFGWGGYGLAVYLVITTLFEALRLAKKNQQSKRLGF